ncbi:pentapeptide repeat-containing protein [Nocardiopsis sp. M1B1]|uniref:pentapeptide repeat-containing protein n=1 Tax=Nocardiopsis sp. M1B1 TaxID=3450454 RepID=UPI0040398940
MAITPPADTNSWRKRFKERTARAIAVLRERRVGLSWNGIIIGGLGAGVALWPLIRAVWDLLGLTTGQTWRLGFLGACTLVLAAGVVGVAWKRTSPVRLVWLILTAWLVAAGAVAVLTALAWLVLGTPNWQPLKDLTPKHLDAITTRAFAIVAGLGGVALLVIAYRRQRTSENGEQREVTKLFTERFTTAVGQLGEEEPAVRLGGVHALAHLADDAPEGRDDLVQMVIDVLCAYLRMPYTPDPGPVPQDATEERKAEHREYKLEFASFRQVRHTIIRIIGNHLREDTRWRGKNYDFTGVVFDGGNLHGAHFSGGVVDFGGAEFISGEVDFHGATFIGATVDFHEAKFTGGWVHFGGATFTGGWVHFGGATFTGGKVTFGSVFSGGVVDFGWAEFADGEVDFSGAEFTGGRVEFGGAMFFGGTLDFSKASGTCPSGLLETMESGESGVALVSELWQPTVKGNGDQEGPATFADAHDH